MKRVSSTWALAAWIGWLGPVAGSAAQSFDDPPPSEPAGSEAPVPPLPDVEMKPTEVGVRFTPGLARAIAGQLTRQMKTRYELSGEQVESVRDILARQIMRLAHDAQPHGRDAFELMLETMIANDGSFPGEEAVRFAQLLEPVMPKLERFIKETTRQIASEMPFRQRLKFTTESTAAIAGFNMFKSRMEEWARGDVDPQSNRFEPNDERADVLPADPNEPAQLTRARRRAERRVLSELDRPGRQWRRYVEQAIAFYEFDESQTHTAEGILKECESRLDGIKTPDWEETLRQNRIKRYLGYELGPDFGNGPWMFKLEQEYDGMLKPVNDLFTELKRRLETLPTSVQQAAALKRTRDKYAELGLAI
ncbi:MAG: hypothetical protein V3T70_00320 [Phycisphaerae bacterium]